MSKDDIDFVKNVLRQGTVKWSGRSECLQRARKKVFERRAKNGNKIYKYHWLCAICEQWYRDIKLMEVDHVVEVGAFTGDWGQYIDRLYNRRGLQALCVVCHLKKTKAFNSAKTRWVRKKKASY